jgi:mitochondrial fission protein ELM1
MTGQRDIWVVSDGKAGHLNQSLGLAEALQRLHPALVIRQFPAQRGFAATLRALLPYHGSLWGPAPAPSWGPAPAPSSAPGPAPSSAPALVIGAGHGTHASLIRWRQRGRTRSIVLMRPSLPRRLFDLCIEPRHDGGTETGNRWLSLGPLNRMRPAAARGATGLLLIGGPSPHFHWDSEALLEQLAALCTGADAWELTTSRRTPPDFLQRLQALGLPGLRALDADALPPGWLLERLPRAPRCWVTPDSASMVYEALTAGCAVGLLDLPPRAGSRVAAGLAQLRAQGWCSAYPDHDPREPLRPPPRPLAEADRLALRIVEEGWL